MKKTFTISLGYSIFNVEEDAYQILKTYLDSIKNYFQKMENDSEIISDFELRIAENFSSKLSSGKQYINLIDVKEDVNYKIMDIVKKHNSDFAFPSSSVYLHQNN